MIKVFSTECCSLGEGPLWNKRRNSLFWVDINNKKIFEKAIDSNRKDYDQCWRVDFTVSALAEHSDDSDKLWLISEKALFLLDMKTGDSKDIVDFDIPSGFRTNDAGVSPDGKIWFGIMEKKPTIANGAIYSIDCRGRVTEELSGIGIPNTMQWLNQDTLYFSDSLRKKMYVYDLVKKSKGILFDLAGTTPTPDGSAFDTLGNLWNARWAGYQVVCHNKNGQVLDAIEVPSSNVTSCCFGGEKMDQLFITTASEGLTKEELKKYPNSGCLFVAEVASKGKVVSGFFFMEEA